MMVVPRLRISCLRRGMMRNHRLIHVSFQKQAWKTANASLNCGLRALPAFQILGFSTASGTDGSARLLPAMQSSKEEESDGEQTTEAWRGVKQIKLLCKRNDPLGAEQVIRQVERHCQKHADSPKPDIPLPKPPPLKIYKKVLYTYTGRNMPREAERLLNTMMRTPDVETWNICLTAWQRAGNPRRAHTLLEKLIQSDTAKPNTKSFNIVLSGYAKAERADEASALLQEMHSYSEKHPQARVDRVTLTSMLKVLSSQGKADDARAVLERMEFSSNARLRPNAFLYVNAIQALAPRKRDAYTLSEVPPDTCDKALDLLKFMKERYLERRDNDVKPDGVVYNAVLNVLARFGDGERAERMLQQMLRGEDPDGLLGQDDVPLPTTVSYGTVLLAWRNSDRKDAAERAESLLRRIPKPNVLCYTTVISAWGKRGKAERAEGLLDELHRIYNEKQSHDMFPNTVVFSAAIEAWATSGDKRAVSRIEALLKQMETKGPPPNTVSYNTLIKAIENSDVENKAQRANDVLVRMRAHGIDPEIRTYNSVLWACSMESRDENKQIALKMAFNVFQESRRTNDLRSCQFSYPAMLRCCGNLNPGGKYGYEIVDQVFGWCKDEGKVGGLVLEHLRRACADEHMKELLGLDDVSIDSLQGGKALPEPWIRNNSYRQALRRNGGWSQKERQAYAKEKYG